MQIYIILIALTMNLFALPSEFKVQRVDQPLKDLNPEYLVSTPALPKGQKAKLLIYLHGSGGRGHDIQRLAMQLRALHVGLAPHQPTILLAPQCARTQQDGSPATWLPSDLNILLDHALSTLPIDEDKVYLTGNSMGGYGTWVWGATSPERFAAIAPVAGGIGAKGPKDVTNELDLWAKSLAKVPVYAYTGGQDRVVPAEYSQRLIKMIKTAGGQTAVYKEYPQEGHGVRQIVYSSELFYQSLFKH